MRDLLIDDIGMGLLRQLHEADEALQAVKVMIKLSPKKVNWKETYEDYWEREQNRDTAAEALLSHLLIIPCASIDTSPYERLWKDSLKLPERERENGKLWDAVEDIACHAIALYKQYGHRSQAETGETS